MSSTHRHLLLDFFWQVISGPPCIYSYIQVLVTFKIYIVFKNTWEDWGDYFALQEKVWNSLFIFA
jgi:hypothetical protein